MIKFALESNMHVVANRHDQLQTAHKQALTDKEDLQAQLIHSQNKAKDTQVNIRPYIELQAFFP
jgi:hypothetical protein